MPPACRGRGCNGRLAGTLLPCTLRRCILLRGVIRVRNRTRNFRVCRRNRRYGLHRRGRRSTEPPRPAGLPSDRLPRRQPRRFPELRRHTGFRRNARRAVRRRSNPVRSGGCRSKCAGAARIVRIVRAACRFSCQMNLSPILYLTSSMNFLMFCSLLFGQIISTSSVSTTMYSSSPSITVSLPSLFLTIHPLVS